MVRDYVFEDNIREYKLVAPDVDELLRYFDNRMMNPTGSTPSLLAAAESILDILAPMVSTDKYDEVKAIWLRIPRGEITDYDSYEDMKNWGEVDTYDEYKERWLEDYPDEYKWYRLVAVRSLNKDATLRYYGISLGFETVISATVEERVFGNEGRYYAEEAACKLCEIIIPAVKESMALLSEGKYNAFVESSLPYYFRAGVIRRSDLRAAVPESKETDYDGLAEETIQAFKRLIVNGNNSEDRIGRIRDFTANDFFRACRIGYEAIGKDCSGFTLPDLYMHYADGRDEGLTGRGHGLNAGPGIDFGDPIAWDDWYHGKRGGGHPWEVVPGGNSTHVELYVMSDKQELEWAHRLGNITDEDYSTKIKSAGYYFCIEGIQRPFEAISFYVALSSAGLPVIIGSARALLARIEATDWIGVVPHHLFTRYCEELFPEEYGTIIDFTHVYKNEDAWFDKIKWLPEEPATTYHE